MTNEEIEAEYDKAMARYSAESGPRSSVSHYFFYAGAEFGLQSASSIYSDIHAIDKPLVEASEEVS